MSSPNTFQSVLQFTTNDLISNRNGQLSEDQVRILKQKVRGNALTQFAVYGVIWIIMTVILVVALSPLLSSRGSLKLNSSAIPLLVPLVGWAWFLVTALRWLFKAMFLQTPRLGRMRGMIVLGNPMSTRGSRREIEINGKALTVSQDLYRLIDPARTYTIYTARYSPDETGQIVAIEEGGAAAAGDNNKTPQQYEKETLQQVLSFTDADLKRNEAGRLSPEQIANLSRTIGKRILGDLLLGLIIAFFLLVFVLALSQSIGVTAVFALAAVVASLMFALFRARRQQQALAVGRVTRLNGTVKAWITTVHHGGRNAYVETIYHLQFGTTELRVARDIYYAFKDGQTYNVYQAADMDNQPLVSAEQVS